MHDINNFDDLCQYLNTENICFFPCQALWFDGKEYESTDVEMNSYNQLVIDGRVIDVNLIKIEHFENGCLNLLVCADYEYFVICCYREKEGK